MRSSAYALLAGAALLLVHLLVGERAEFNDFRLIWLAGRLWGQGVDPYTPAYLEASRTLLPRSAAIPWFYPFQWYGLAVPLGWLPPQLAMRVFMILSVAASLGTGLLMVRAATDAGVRMPRAFWALMLAFCLTSTIWDAVLRGRQPVIVAALGIPLLVRGLQRSSRPLVIFGLVLLLAKPQMGVPFWVAVALQEGWLMAAIVAGAISAILSIPALAVGGGLATVPRLLQVMTHYQGDTYNQAMNMTGLPQILFRITGRNLSLAASAAIGIVGGCLAGLALRKKPRIAADDLAIGFVLLLPLTVATFVSLHPYDLIILSFALPFLPKMPKRALIPFAIGYALLWRPENIVGVWHSESADAAAVATLGLVLLIAATITVWRAHYKRNDPAPVAA